MCALQAKLSWLLVARTSGNDKEFKEWQCIPLGASGGGWNGWRWATPDAQGPFVPLRRPTGASTYQPHCPGGAVRAAERAYLGAARTVLFALARPCGLQNSPSWGHFCPCGVRRYMGPGRRIISHTRHRKAQGMQDALHE